MLNLFRKRLKLLFQNKELFFTFLCFFIVMLNLLNAQGIDSVNAIVTVDSVDTVQTSLWPALIRSAIIPGWGQIEQENPGRAVIFYGLGLTFLYNIAYNYYWYRETNRYINKSKYRQYAFLYLQLYTINIIDVIESHRIGDDKPWPQDRFNDLPMKSPWGAVTRSAMLPGWGQIYNESYIKSVVAFGTFFYFAGRVYNYDQEYKRTSDVSFRDKRVLNSWYLGLTYLLILADAYVDAYLFEFDETVSMTYEYLPEEKTFTLGLHVTF